MQISATEYRPAGHLRRRPAPTGEFIVERHRRRRPVQRHTARARTPRSTSGRRRRLRPSPRPPTPSPTVLPGADVHRHQGRPDAGDRVRRRRPRRRRRARCRPWSTRSTPCSTTVKTYTANAQGSTAALKGDYSVTLDRRRAARRRLERRRRRRLAGASIGLPADQGRPGHLRQGHVPRPRSRTTRPWCSAWSSGTPAGIGPDGVVGGGDDVAAVTGIAGRLAAVAQVGLRRHDRHAGRARQRPGHADQGHPGPHRRLGPAPGQAQGDAAPGSSPPWRRR